MEAVLLVGRELGAIAPVSALVGEVAQERHGAAELIAAIFLLLDVSLLVLDNLVLAVLYDIGIFCKVRVNVRKEGGVYVELGKHVAPVNGVGLYLVQNLQRVGDSFRMVREQRGHFLLALEVLLLGVAQAFGIVHGGVGGEADEAVVGGAVVLVHKVNVVGGHHLHAVLLRQLEDFLGIELLLFVQLQAHPRNLRLVEHHLQVIVIAKDLLVPLDGGIGAGGVACDDRPRHLSRQTGGAAYKVCGVLLYDLVRDAGAVVETLYVRGGHYLHQILVAVVVLGQQDQVIVFAVLLVVDAVVILGNVHLATHYGLDLREFLGYVQEVLHAVHIAVVRDGQARHSQFRSPLEELGNIGHSIQDGVLGMDVKMDERHNTKLQKNARIP